MSHVPRQEIDVFGEIAGVSFSPDNDAFFVGIAVRYLLQGVAGRCRVLQDVVGCCRVLRCVAGCCSVLQGAAVFSVYCSVW